MNPVRRFAHFMPPCLGQEVHYYIAYFTELILQICVYAQKRRIYRENCKYALDKN